MRIISIANSFFVGIKGSFLDFNVVGGTEYLTTSNQLTNANQWYVLTYRLNADFSVDFSINGSQTFENKTGTTNTSGTGLIYLGCNPNTALTEYFNGDIAHISIIGSALTLAQYNQVVGQLANQYSLATTIPQLHPYRSINPLMKLASLNMNNNTCLLYTSPSPRD